MKPRPKDAMLTRFTGPVMDQICALVPDFHGKDNLTNAQAEAAANRFYKKLLAAKWFQRRVEQAEKRSELAKTLPGPPIKPIKSKKIAGYSPVTISSYTYRCTHQAEMGWIELPTTRHGPMQILHLVAHYLQPDGSPWHGGEFGSIFLDLIQLSFNADTKRAAKDIMLNNNIKTSVRSDATREKQSAAFHDRKVKQAPEKLIQILREMRELQGE